MSAPSAVSGSHAPSHRLERVNSQLRAELAACLLADVKDPRVGMATVVSVSCSRDLQEATVRISVVGDDARRRLAVDRLEHLGGFLRHRLGERLTNLRRIPRLHFVLDESIAYAVHISEVLERLPDRAGGEKAP